MLTELNSNWLDEELKKFDCNENPQQAAILFKEKVKEALTNCLLKSKWELEEFLSLIIACNMAEEFCTTYNMQPCIDLNRRALGEYYTYPLTQWNVCEIKQRLNQYYIHALALLKQVQKNSQIPIEVSPIEWLELVESIGEELFIPSVEKFLYEVIWPTSPEPGTYLSPKTVERIESSKRPPIVRLMAEIIRFHHYGIDSLIAKRGIFPVSRLGIDEAARYLGISINQIIEKCFEEESLGAYLKKGQFKIRKFLTTSSQCFTRSYIDEISKPSYRCKYKGLVRLEKSSTLYPDNTLEKIYEGSCIDVPHKDSYTIVPLQSSLAELVQGVSQVIELRKGQKITINDLIFVRNELCDHIKNMPEEGDDVPLALRKFVTEAMKSSKILKPKPLWIYLQKIVEKNVDRCEVITDLMDWEADAKLFYKTSEKTDDRSISLKRFQNLVGEIKKEPSFKLE